MRTNSQSLARIGANEGLGLTMSASNSDVESSSHAPPLTPPLLSSASPLIFAPLPQSILVSEILRTMKLFYDGTMPKAVPSAPGGPTSSCARARWKPAFLAGQKARFHCTGEAGGLFELEKVLKVMRSPCSVEQIKDLVMRCDCIRYIT